MQWTEVIEQTAEKTGYSVEKTSEVLHAMMNIITQAMKTENIIHLPPSFGAIAVKDVEGKAVGTGGKQLTKGHRTPVIKMSPHLKKELKENDDDYLQRLRKSGRHEQAAVVDKSLRADGKRT